MVLPRRYGFNTVAVALLALDAEGQPLLGLDDDDLPAAQCFVGNSELLVTPSWRIPRQIVGIAATRAWILRQLEQCYGLRCGAHCWELGGRYHPSPGVTPEVVYPLAVQVHAAAAAQLPLHWVRLSELVAQRRELRDGHLRIVALRAAHALGLLVS